MFEVYLHIYKFFREQFTYDQFAVVIDLQHTQTFVPLS